MSAGRPPRRDALRSGEELRVAVGGGVASPDEATTPIRLVTRPGPGVGEVVRYDALAILLTGIPGAVREASLDAAVQAFEAALRDEDSVTIGAALTLGAHAADGVLAGDQPGTETPPAPSAAAAVAAVLHSGQWTLLEAGGHQAFLCRGSSTGPAFSHGSVSPPLGAEGCSPRITTFRAHPGDLIFLASPDAAVALDVGRTAVALRLAPDTGAACEEIASHVAVSRPGSHGFAALGIAEPPPRAGLSLGATAASGVLLLCAAVLALLAMAGAPSKPRIPTEARNANLLRIPTPAESGPPHRASRGTESQPGRRLPDVPSLIGFGGESGSARTAPRVEPSTKGQYKIVGPPGTYAELREAKPGGAIRKGEVREGQGSFVFYNLPIPAQYTLTVWPSKSRQTPIVKDKRVSLTDPLPGRFDTSQRNTR